MNNNENDNPKQVSKEDLLRFLDAGPKVLRWPRSGELARESCVAGHSRPGCPAAESYMELATGAVEGDEAEKLLAHAADCDACGDVLAWNLSALEGDPSAEEATAIAELAAARMDWQEKMARDLAATSARRRPLFLHHGRWRAGAAIAAVLLLAAGLVVWQRQTNNPDHQLAMAYEQSRTLELRVPEADYAALNTGGHTRGALAGHEPAPLLDARARLARELERSPQNAHWLQLQARADTLEERYDSATDVLDRLLAQGPVTADLLTDAASAYYQRGLISGSELDRSTALDYLRRADELAPTDPVILFNEAIVMEDRGQMMNAVEVWNRYITVERDAKWADEGKRKLAALEQTLNRLKSHQSRVEKMLATPQAMDALAADAPKLATLDEELSSYELDKLLLAAFPETPNSLNREPLKKFEQARGSPCLEPCLATRRLLQAIATSLKIQHHDSWLADLLPPNIDSLPAASAVTYARAVQLLAHAVREDISGIPTLGAQEARQARVLFQQLSAVEKPTPSVASAVHAGEERAAVEEMFALQRAVDFQGCRALAGQLRARPDRQRDLARYPWIEAQALVTEKICDDTPETRLAGRGLEMAALRLAEAENYRLLASRTEMRLAEDAESAGDHETSERLTLATLHKLYSADTPPMRIAGTVGLIGYAEQDSPRAHMAERCTREELGWIESTGNHVNGAQERMYLARAEFRIGAMGEAEKQIQLAHLEGNAQNLGESKGIDFAQANVFLARLMLERGDLAGAQSYLDETAGNLAADSDTWTLRAYASSRGQLDLAAGQFDQAAKTLEEEIRASEGRNVRGGDRATAAEYAQQDHDLYAELAATWLAQGRRPESVLALWERFRLRSRGLLITPCRNGALDCEEPELTIAQQKLGSSTLIGQIVLLDRVLTYRADKQGVVWNQKPWSRQDVLDAAQTLDRAVSSPYTSPETAAKLGARLADALLPPIPASLSTDSTLLLEPDPMLQNLPWPVLPTAAGPLGLQFPLDEMRSILAVTARSNGPGYHPVETMCKRPLVVGASMATGNEPPLPEALEEASSVSHRLRSTELLLGRQATTANLAQMLGSATIFHFAGHAIQTGNGTELLLAASSPGEVRPWVDGAFLRQHPPRDCQLAVLSACSTGTREASWNHPLQDIVETLGDLGVPEVVATRWQIDSEAAVPFMDSFYQTLATGKSVAMALTSARRVQFSESLYKNPYYWGAYYVTGGEATFVEKDSHGRR
jgi:CHAT domain-containing protein/tetratricopeptide (TPR) repeat protein